MPQHTLKSRFGVFCDMLYRHANGLDRESDFEQMSTGNNTNNKKSSPHYSKIFLGCINLGDYIHKDKNYFINIGKNIKYNRTNTLILMF
jgi:hypothetical protein